MTAHVLLRRAFPRGSVVLAGILIGAASARGQTNEESPIAGALERARSAIDAIVAIPDAERSFENTVLALDDLGARFFEEARMTAFMAQVSTDAAERERGRRAAAEMGEWFILVNKHEGLYEAIRAFAGTDPELDPLQARLVDRLLRDFQREGMALPAEDRERLVEIDKELNTLGLEFQQNIRDDETALLLTSTELVGVPETFLASLPRAGELYVCAMKGAIPGRIVGTCEVESTRLKVVTANSRRAGARNVEVLEKLLRLRHEKARLLGYAHTADYRTEDRMAQNAANVAGFYERLKPKLRLKALQDKEEFEAAKREHTGDADARLQAWDFLFYKNWLLREKYAVDSEKVREYFSVERVQAGLFDITQALYGVEYRDVTERAREAGRPLWHEDVRLYEVWDDASGQLLGEFYTDLYPRPNKYTHAAQFPLALRKVWPVGTATTALVELVCNFTKPTADRPALLSHSEVETFFHEFGHCLHSIFSRADYANLSSAVVSQDFIEAPSQMFENWVWDREVLGTFARHYETGESFPDGLLDGLIAARNLGSGLATEGQVYLGTMDLMFHTDEDGVVDTDAVRDAAYVATRVFEPIENIRSQSSFGHLVGYHAGYYGYLWSLVYAQDMFSRFAETGLMNKETAAAYRDTVLAPGSTRDELDMVRDFLGREPDSDAFLRHLGLNPL